MCFYFKQSKDALSLANRFKIKLKDNSPVLRSDFINGFSHPVCPVITNSEPNVLSNFQWGLIPEGSDTSIMKYTLNGRIETLDKRVSFANILNNRCLVIADGFYEWKERNLNGRKNRERYLFTSENEESFAFAGLYSIWQDKSKDQLYNSFTILTTEANNIVASIHSKGRMPVILKMDDEQSWLSGAKISEYAHPYSVNLLARPYPQNKEDVQNLLF
jgi:putative SOS response-associated peptidase YedK